MTTPAELLKGWILGQAGTEAGWAEAELGRLAAGGTERDLHLFLGLAPRRLGKADLRLTAGDIAAAAAARDGWAPGGWSLDGAARVLALLTFTGARPFAETFRDLRRTADAAEMIALYRGLPLYPDPESLHFEAGEGLRSNLKPVFEAIAHENPFPRDHFDDHRWNHMVLKALFIGAELGPVTGLAARANPELAEMLVNTAQERWAAGRPVSPEIWALILPFADRAPIASVLARARAEGHSVPETAA